MILYVHLSPLSVPFWPLGPGFEPPASMDLTAWHKKRTDPSEWCLGTKRKGRAEGIGGLVPLQHGILYIL